VLAVNSASRKLARSVFWKEDGHEEAVYGSVDHRISEGGTGWDAEEFRQVGTSSKEVESTGLGIAISRRFIELHGGRIWVKSEIGSGATFAFTLPVG